MQFSAVLALQLLAIAPSAFGQSQFFTGSYGALWSGTQNWQGGTLPTNSTTVYLGNFNNVKAVVNAPGAVAGSIQGLGGGWFGAILEVTQGGGITVDYGATFGTAVGGGGQLIITGGTFTNRGNLSLSPQTDAYSRLVISGTNGVSGLYTTEGGYVDLGSSSYSNTRGEVIVNAGGILQTRAVYSQSQNIGFMSLNGGTLRFSDTTSLGVSGFKYGDLRLGGNLDSTIEVLSGRTATINTGFTGSGGLIKAGTGTLTLTGTSAYSGTTTVNNGTLLAGSERGFVSGSGAYRVNGGILNMNDYDLTAVSLAGTGGVVNLSNTSSALLTLNQNENTTFNGTITGSGGLIKSGTGTLSLGGAHTFTGTTAINGGIVALAGSGSLASRLSFDSGTLRNASSLTVNASTEILSGGASFDTTSGTLNMQGIISGTGAISKTGAGTLSLNGVNTFSSTVSVTGGVLSVTSNDNLGAFGTRVNFDGGTFRTNGTSFTRNMTIGSGGLTWDVTTGTASSQGFMSGTGALTKTGVGTLSLGFSSANTFNGVTINQGTLFVNNGNVLGNDAGIFVINGGTFANAAGVTLNRSMTLGASGATFRNTFQTMDLQGVISGAGSLTKEGSATLFLSGTNNTYSGSTTINGGAIAINSAASLGSATSAIAINNGTLQGNASLTLTRAIALGNGVLDVASGTWTQQGIISGNALTKTGTGTLFLTATNTYVGNTSINGGVLAINSLSNIGAGTMSFDGGQLQATGFDLASTLTFNAGGGGFHIETGTLTYSGTIVGTGALTKSGTGVLALTGSLNGYAGAMNMNGGILAITNNGNLTGGALSFNGGTMRAATLTMNRDWLLNTAGGGVDVTSGTFTHAGLISGTGGLVKSGSGLLIITGTNTYQGATAINGGILSFTNTANLGSASGGISFNTGTLQASGIIARNTTLNAGGGTLDIASQLSMTGSISGAGGLAKIGTGTLTLTGTNTYTGTTSINGGALIVSANENLGASSAAFALNNATLRTTAGFAMNRAATLGAGGGIFDVTTGTLNQSGLISGAGNLTKTGTGTLILGGTNTYTGTTAINAGIISVSDNANLGNAVSALSLNSGTLRSTAAFSMNRATTLGAGGGTFDVATGTLTQSGLISGSGNLFKTGLGALLLGGTNTYTGTTAINGGLVAISNNANLGNASSVLTLNSGTLQTTAGLAMNRATTLGAGGGTVEVSTGTLAHSGLISGAGNLTKSGAGVLTLGGTNTYSGTTVISDGVVAVSTDGNLGNSAGGLALNGGTLRATVGFAMNRAATLGASGGTFDVTSGTLTQSGLISGAGGLTKSGAGSFVLNGTNTYTGTTAINGGLISVSNNANLGNASGALALNGGTLRTTAGFTMNRATTLGASAGTFDVTTGTLVHNGPISGAGNLLKNGAGVLLLGGTNTYTGTTGINAGVVSVAANENLGQGAAALSLNGGTLQTTAGFSMNRATNLGGSGGTFEVATGTLSQQGVISGAGSLIKTGTGVLALQGSNTYTGTTAVNAGIVSVSDNANLGGGSAELIFNSGTLRTTSGFSMNRATTLGVGGGTFDITTGTLAQQGAFSGTGALAKLGLGQLNLSGSSTYTGPASVLAGTLSLQANAALGTGTISVNNFAGQAATLQIRASVGNAVTLANGAVLENSGTITRSGANQFAVSGLPGGTPVTVRNLAGASIVSTNNYGVQLQSGGTVQNTGGAISGGFNAIYIVNAPGSVTNESGGRLHGNSQGVQMLSGGVILNTSSTISGGGIDGVSVGSVVGSTSSIQNLAGSSIVGGRHGIALVTTGTVYNDNSRVSGTTSGINGGSGFVQNVGGGIIQGGTHGISFTNSSTITNTGSSTISGGTAGVELQNGGVITNGVGSVISGSTGVIGEGAAVTLVNSGSIQGGVTLGNFANTATLNMGSVINGNLALGSNSAARLILAGTGTQRYSDAVTGATTFSGTLTKQDAGQWTLDRAITGLVQTQVSAGKLVVTSTVSGNFTVASGATLGGSGRIGGNLAVQTGATLAPGNSIETLTVLGDASFASGSIFSVEGNGALFDRLNVGGAVSITSGAQLSFTLLGSLSESAYTLMTAASGLDGTVQFTLSGLPVGYEMLYNGTSLVLSRIPANVGPITVTPNDTTIITGGTTAVVVEVGNTAPTGSEDLDATATGDGGNLTGSGTATVVAGTTGTIAPDLQFSSTNVGQAQTGTVTVSDPDATSNPQTGTVTVNVLDHAYPTLSITGGNNQTVIVGALNITSTLTLANGTSGTANLSPMDVDNLSAGLSGTTGSGVIASGSSAVYTGSLNTGTVGLAQTQTFSLDAGDNQVLPGANPLTTQTGTVTLTVLGHAEPLISILGDGQNVIVGATGVTASINLANGLSGTNNLSPMSVANLSANLTGTTGNGIVASGSSATYTAAINTGTVGAGQTQAYSLDAGDDQTLAGANALAQQSGTLTVNVYGHADGSISGTTFNLGNVHLGYSATTSNTQTVTNGTTGAYIVDLKTSATTSGNITVSGVSGISAGNSGTIAATLATGQSVGVINETITYTYADDSTYLGASNNLGTSTLSVTGNVYSGQGVWTSTAGGTWGTLTTDFGLNWAAAGGTPGLDAAFADTDTALFGTLGSGTVTLDGSAPSLAGVTFNNASGTYTLAQGTGTSALTLNGGNSGTSTLTNQAGNHSIEIPLVLATDVQVSVTNALDTLSIKGLISGAGAVHVGGSGQVLYTQAQTYSGPTVVNGGVLATQDLASAVTLNGGAFSPGGLGTISNISVGSLTLNGGSLLFNLGDGVNDHITITDGLGALTAPSVFTFNDIGLTTGVYSLLSGLNPGWDITQLGFNGLTGWAGTFLLSVDETELLISLYSGGPIAGTIIQNSAPVGTPPTADFVVTGIAQTNTPAQSNTINSLTFDPATALTVFNTLNITSGNLTVGSGSATLQGGQIVAPNGFTKLGEGIINVLNTILVNGPTNVMGGTLAMNGSITTTDLIVQFGAWLKGNGVIFGNVFNNGTVAPGNSPGTLTINGNFTQSSNGTLEIEIASLSNFDRLIVSGNANLAGTLNVVPFGGFNLKYGQQFAFLQAGSITGDFNSIVMPNPGQFRGRFLAEDGTGTLLIAPTSYTLVAETQNQKNVAKALDSFISATSGDREAVSIALDLQTAEQYPAAFEAIAPGFYESLTDTTIELAVSQSQMIAQRLSAVRLGSRGFSAVGIEAPLRNDRDGKSVMDAKGGKDILTPSVDNKWGVWVQGNGIFAKTTATNMLPNYRSENGGFFVGADYAWNEGFTTGVFTGYQGTYNKYANGSSASINSALFGGYATYKKGGFYSDAIITGGYNGYIAKRSIEFSTVNRTARSNPNGGQLTTYLDAGYDWNAKGFTFGPLASVQYTYAGVAPFTESGADSLDLRVQQQNANSLRTNLGGRIAYTWNLTDKITIIPEVRMFWQHEFLQNSVDIGASLDGGNGPGFDYATTVPDRDSIFAAVGVSAVFNKNFSGYIYYNSNFARSDYMSQMISTGLNWKF